MLRHRLILGPIMIIAAFCIFWADASLSPVNIKQYLDSSPCFYCTAVSSAVCSYPVTGLILAAIMIFILLPIACNELAHLFTAKGININPALMTIATITTCLALYLSPALSTNHVTSTTIIITILIAAFLLTLIQHSRRADPNGSIAAAGATMTSIIMLGLMPAFLLLMRQQHTAWVVMAVILITKSCDIGAYFTGRLIGRHKLIPWLSPGKTWEGLAGGAIFAALVAVAFTHFIRNTHLADSLIIIDNQLVPHPSNYSLLFAAIVGITLALVGQTSDLMISLFKRDANLKDSSSSIPGFGGVLDVFDSLLLTAPVAYWLLYTT